MIYFDHNATTPLDPSVLEAMMPFLSGSYGNPSSQHAIGQEARRAVERSRRKIADLVGADPRSIIFTGSGTEANNLALRGSLTSGAFKGKHLIVGALEHPSVLAPAEALRREGYEVSIAPVTSDGEVRAEDIEPLLRPDTALISVMHAQNEVGTINQVHEICELIGYRRILVHCDAAQSVGKIPTSFPLMGTNLMTMVAHKFHGPKGIGALVVSRGISLESLHLGGGQELGRRGGTENVASIVGFAAALELAWGSRLADQGERITALRDYVHLRIAEELPGVLLNGHVKYRLPSTLNLSFLGVSGAELAGALAGVAVGTGAACHAASDEGSPCLRAMGFGIERASSALRLSFGRDNTVDEADKAIDEIVGQVRRLRSERGIDQLPRSDRPRCPRSDVEVSVMSTSGGLLIAGGGGHLLPLPGTRPPE